MGSELPVPPVGTAAMAGTPDGYSGRPALAASAAPAALPEESVATAEPVDAVGYSCTVVPVGTAVPAARALAVLMAAAAAEPAARAATVGLVVAPHYSSDAAERAATEAAAAAAGTAAPDWTAIWPVLVATVEVEAQAVTAAPLAPAGPVVPATSSAITAGPAALVSVAPAAAAVAAAMVQPAQTLQLTPVP
ncbi:hypothetical protein NJB18091_42830 [Mycobacterium marinum]|nr:hypothetical protein NJB18091_42830 [Mycobacterium marinum]